MHDTTPPREPADPDGRRRPGGLRLSHGEHRLGSDEAHGTPRWNPDDGDFS